MSMLDDEWRPPVADEDGFDTFLDDATHAVHDIWQDRHGRPLTIDELYELNDLLTGYFGDKRPTPQGEDA